MNLELHTWGPGFDLPSIDPDCLASILFLQHFLTPGSWCIVPCGDPSVIPSGQLPCLKDDSVWISGYHNITEYLCHTQRTSANIESNVSSAEAAQVTAYSVFIQSRGRPLLDLSFYVSSENYNGATRAVLAEVLDWPSSWSTPHQLRRDAKARSDHLGLSGLDVDAATDPERESVLANHLPESMKRSKSTVSKTLGRQEQRNRIRLDSVTRDFLEPIDDLLRGHDWLVGNSASSVDFLALGYLLLMERPQLPHAWLQSTLQNDFSRVDQWVKATTQTLQNTNGTKRSGSRTSDQHQLPWAKPKPRTWTSVAGAIVTHTIGASSSLRYDMSEVPPSQSNTVAKRSQERQLARAGLQARKNVYDGFITSLVGCSSMVAWLLWAGILKLPRQTTSRGHTRVFGRQPLGEAESILMGFS